ncbi:tRNA(fMet)-specific endonuclease VapC [Spirochaetia bacterium]|nr:tRNA(fMet)-specific endonuclease VapC [Spirochaetia bacterium]
MMRTKGPIALDTNIISYWLRGLYNLEKKLEIEFDRENSIVIPPITYYEILRGLYFVDSKNKLRYFELLCNRLGKDNMEKADWIKTAELYARCRKSGQTMEESDLLLAGFYLRHNYILVTHNTEHFSHIADLDLEDWIK